MVHFSRVNSHDQLHFLILLVDNSLFPSGLLVKESFFFAKKIYTFCTYVQHTLVKNLAELLHDLMIGNRKKVIQSNCDQGRYQLQYFIQSATLQGVS